MRSRLAFVFTSLALVLGGCSAERAAPSGPVDRMMREAAAKAGVSRDLVAAIAYVEGGFALRMHRDVDPDELVKIAGVMELRRGRFDSLARGAELMHLPSLEIQRDLALGTEAGCRVLADLAAARGVRADDIGGMSPVVEELSGHLSREDQIEYRARVMKALRFGATATTRDGEAVVIPAHDEVPLSSTFAPPTRAALDTPEFAGAVWFDTPSTPEKWNSGRDEPLTRIVIHDTEGGWDASVATLQNDGGKSTHYIVDADGSRVGQFVHEADTAYHCGNHVYNNGSVGIEHVGFAADDAYQTAMYEKSAALVNDVAKRNHLGPNGDGSGLDRDLLIGHQEVPATPQTDPPCGDSPADCIASGDYGGSSHHTDPGVHWEWCHYTDILGNGATCKCNDAYSHYNCSLDGTLRVKCPSGTVEIDPCSNGCTIQALGVDDTCNPTASASSSVGSGGAGGAAGAGGAGGQGGADGDATGASSYASTGASSHHGSGGGKSGGDGAVDEPAEDSGCSASGAGAGQGGLAGLIVAAALTFARRRRQAASSGTPASARSSS